MKRFMRVFSIMLAISISSTSAVYPRPAYKNRIPSQWRLQIHNDKSDRPVDKRRLYISAQVDTYTLAEYEFDSLGLCDTEGWHGTDITAQKGTFFHVDTFRVINGSQSLWCGVRPSSNPLFCAYATLPGYGNSWDQCFESKDFQTTGDVTVSFLIRYDSEPGFDYTYADWSNDGGSTWSNMITLDDSGYMPVSTLIPAPDSIRVRFHFTSDYAWSDEDGFWDTEGAVIIDDLSIVDAAGTVDFEDFENEAFGDTASLDGDWVAYATPAYGDFSGLFSGLAVVQDEDCNRDVSCLWGFFNGSTDNFSCNWPDPHPEQLVVPYGNDRGQYIQNEIWSPWIEWNPGGAVPPTASRATLDFWVYRDLLLDNLVYYLWRVRSLIDGCPSHWTDPIIYYGSSRNWYHVRQGIGYLIDPEATHIQIALGVIDMCRYYCGIFGSGACHSHAPLFDHVKLYRVDFQGPIWSARDMDIFQDNFPADGTTTGTVRCDMAQDRIHWSSPNIRPGDSLTVNIVDMNTGLGTDPIYGKASTYIHVRSTGGQTHNAVSGDLSRWPVTGVTGGWTKILMDTAYMNPAMTSPVPDRFCVDLNDNLFTPPDMIEYYFSATSADGKTTYWSKDAGTVALEAEARSMPNEMQCLPTGFSNILYVDDFDGWGAQPYFDSAFELIHVEPDRYDVSAPSSMIGNGLGARALASQVNDVYRIIIWSSGNLSSGTIGDGGMVSLEKSPDAQLLYSFLDQSSAWDPGLYITGDDIAEEMKSINSPPFQDLFTYINYSLTNGNHRSAGEPLSPLVIGSVPGIFEHIGLPDTLVAYGGCPLLNDFDVLEATGGANTAMAYQNNPSHAAVVTQETLNASGRTARVLLEGFSYHYIRDDRVQFPPERVDHLIDIISWLEGSVYNASGSGGEPQAKNSLAQNYPNPFNPTTTIRFSLKEKAHVNLKIYNVAGQLVRTLLNKEIAPSEVKPVIWDGLDNRGVPVASGVYFYRIATKDFSLTRKMVVVK